MEFSRLILVFSVALTAVKSSITSHDNPETTTATLSSDLCLQETGCACTDSDEVLSVVCNNITDFDRLQKLANTSIFESKAIEITLKGIRDIPPNIIRNLNISTLTLDDSFIDTISFDVFNGTKALSAFKIKRSSIQALPNFEYVHQTMDQLNLDGSKLTAIQLEVQNLTILKTLTFRDNSICDIDENAFHGLQTLQILDLSSNFLTSLPSRLLDDLVNLRSLILSFNQLTYIGDLFSVINPISIHLDHNNLTNASDIFYRTMTTVEDVDLSYNPLKSIDNHTFNDHIRNARFLSLDHCSLISFDFEHVRALSNLRSINLSSNFIERILEGIVDFGIDLEIYLDDNRISSFETELTFIVKRLHLSGNRMRYLGMMLQLTQIPDVEVNRNQLEAILESDLKGMHDTANLSFSQNLISRIDTWAFSTSLRSDLDILDLSWNQLSTLNGSVNYLSRLTTLDVSHNKIENLRPGEFVGLNELRNLYLQNNKIADLQGQLQSIPQLQQLLVQFNNLTTVKVQQLPKSLRSFHYKGNPIKCNCQFFPFLKWLENSDSLVADSNYCQRLNKSQSNIKSYSHTVGFESFNAENCPQPCKCSCSRNSNDTFIAIDCSSQGIVNVLEPFKQERNSTTNGLSMMMWQNADPRFALKDRILMVNLQNNDITSLDNWTFPSDLTTLELSHNQLTRLPTGVTSLPFLKSISLSGNPWSCDCESLDFKKWVTSKMSGIKDMNDTRCSSVSVRNKLNGKLLISLSDMDLCPVAVGLYIMIVFVVLNTKQLFHRRRKETCNVKFPHISWSVSDVRSVVSVRCLILFVAFRSAICSEEDGFAYDRCRTEIDGCECVDLGQITGVMCDNFTDFELLTRKLSNGSLFNFDPPETYEITLTGIRNIPPQIIKDLMVFHLILDDPSIETISDEAFDGVQRLRRFRIRISSVRKIPNFQKIKHSLRNLNMDSSLVTEIGYEIQHLDLLEEISFRNNTIQTIVEDAFIDLPVLRTLDLSRNQLTVLPPLLLRDLPSLRMLALSYNQLITVNGLLAIARARFILLDHNNLTDADEILHENMTNVENVQLNDNPLTKLSEKTFNTRVPHVRFIYLDRCQLTEFNVRHFANLRYLSLLTLVSNLIEEVPEQVIGFGTSTQIILTDNRISSFKASITTEVKRFFISGNHLKTLGTMFQFTNITELEVNGNELEAITDTNFKAMKQVENIALRGNAISRIDTNAFIWLRNDIQNLDLSSNQLRSLNSSIRLLSNLKSLNISHNSIEVIRQGEFDGLNDLAELYMQYNKIIALPGELQRIRELRFLIFQHNKINTVNVKDLPKTLRFFYFKDNSIDCDCKFLPFLQWLKLPNAPKTDYLYCQRTSDQSAKSMVDIRPNIGFCPEPCRCICRSIANNTHLSIDCSSQNITKPPNLFQNEANDMTGFSIASGGLKFMRQNADPRFAIADKISEINLENNGITSLDDWTFPSELKILRLANNALTKLSPLVMSMPAFKALSLSRNPWACDCEAKDFNQWIIFKTESIIDVNDTRCVADGKSSLSGKLLLNLSERDLCPVSLSFYIPIGFSILVLLLLVAASAILYTQYTYSIKAWLYARGVSCVKKKFQDKDKIFDAFISFSQKDENLVNNEIVSGIEDRLPNIRLCLHERHFLPGEFIYQNIINSVMHSKITVLILSKNFLESNWCKAEFRTAYTQTFKDKVHKIIAIKVGELPEIKDPGIKDFLSKITYIIWGEKLFWQKMIYVLPTPNNKIPPQLVI